VSGPNRVNDSSSAYSGDAACPALNSPMLSSTRLDEDRTFQSANECSDHRRRSTWMTRVPRPLAKLDCHRARSAVGGKVTARVTDDEPWPGPFRARYVGARNSISFGYYLSQRRWETLTQPPHKVYDRPPRAVFFDLILLWATNRRYSDLEASPRYARSPTQRGWPRVKVERRRQPPACRSAGPFPASVPSRSAAWLRPVSTCAVKKVWTHYRRARRYEPARLAAHSPSGDGASAPSFAGGPEACLSAIK